MSGLPEGLVLLILTAIGVVAWWGIQRIVTGQDAINVTLHELCERVGQLETWAEQREQIEEHRHSDNVQAMRDIRSDLRPKP